jgi:hypothetical protein
MNLSMTMTMTMTTPPLPPLQHLLLLPLPRYFLQLSFL